jgi:hypothetical protein
VPPDGDSSTTGGDFGSTVSRNFSIDRSSMRAPFSAIEPCRLAVAIGTRGEPARAAARVSAVPGTAGGAAWPGTGGAPGAPGAVAVCPGCSGVGAGFGASCSACCCAAFCRSACGTA